MSTEVTIEDITTALTESFSEAKYVAESDASASVQAHISQSFVRDCIHSLSAVTPQMMKTIPPQNRNMIAVALVSIAELWRCDLTDNTGDDDDGK